MVYLGEYKKKRLPAFLCEMVDTNTLIHHVYYVFD